MYSDFCVFDESTNFRIYDFIIDITANNCMWEVAFRLFLGSIKTKFDQILVQLMMNIPDFLLALLQKLKTRSIPFYDLDELATCCDLLIFSR